jgi:Tfp pilus assembly protein PilX
MKQTRISLRAPQRQRGVVLFIALIVLVAMSLTGIALIRSVDTSVQVAGNIAFRQVTRVAADTGVEAARNFLNAQTADYLFTDHTGSAYYSTMQSSLDLTGTDPLRTDFNWNTAASAGTDANGNTIQYVIHRMCDTSGNPANVNCVRSTAGSGGGTPAGELKYGTGVLPGTPQVLYRVTTRITGPRNTQSFVQVMII